MLKKLKRCIIDFNQSNFFQSVGLKKQKFAKAEGDFEYYDEEDDDRRPPEVQQVDAQEYYDEEDPEAQVEPVQFSSVLP